MTTQLMKASVYHAAAVICCTLSVCLSVHPMPIIYLKSDSCSVETSNFVETQCLTQVTERAPLRSKVGVTGNRNITSFLWMSSWKVDWLTSNQDRSERYLCVVIDTTWFGRGHVSEWQWLIDKNCDFFCCIQRTCYSWHCLRFVTSFSFEINKKPSYR